MITQFAEAGRRGSTSEACADHDDVCFRLLDGFTSFMLNLCLSHFCSMGPAGTFGSNVASAIFSTFIKHVDVNRLRNEAEGNNHGVNDAKNADRKFVSRVIDSEGLDG